MLKKSILSLMILCVISQTAGLANTIIFQQGVNEYTGSRDCSIFPGMTKAATNRTTLGFTSNETGGVKYVLFKFINLEIPVGHKVVSAQLVLENLRSGSPGREIEIWSVKRPWNEKSCNWECWIVNQQWELPGGTGEKDRSKTPVATATINNEKKGFITIDLPVDLVQGWILKTTPNHGFMLTSKSPAVNELFRASETSLVDKRPKLIIKTASKANNLKKH